MPEVLLDEILGNQMGKNAIFHVKKIFFFYQTTKIAVSAWKFDQKTSENFIFIEKFNIFGKFTLLYRGFS